MADQERAEQRGTGGEVHQTARADGPDLTTNQGVVVSDNQNSLRAGVRGPSLLEDFVLREKLTSFDHERIPERVVHARGAGAHGFFECTRPLGRYTTAGFLQKKGQRVPVFVRFSTVAGSRGSSDLARDVRGFAVKFYTDDGNFDLVGNNIPVFFIQDAIKFPDLIHAVKGEPHNEIPQAASAHDTFWDFVALTPESLHMIMWAMSDRAIPRSLRMMEGFGVHTFRLVNKAGESTFVKYHWRPKLGSFSVLWDEAVKINGADPDFHRRDLWDAIEKGDFPEWELAVQLFTEQQADTFDFDVNDPTKLVPENVVPLQVVGRMVLDRNPDNFFAETEQVAFCASHILPGMGFSNDPLLHGRLFSYLDTQLSRLGSPNFHEIPVNKPRCPFHNFQRDGHMRQRVDTGRVANEPNTIEPKGPRENPRAGFVSFPEEITGAKLRRRSETFADHYSQARLFWRSQTEVEQGHIVAALVFELGKCEGATIRPRVVAHLQHVDGDLAVRVAAGLNLKTAAVPARGKAPRVLDIAPDPSLSLLAKAPRSIAGRRIGCLVAEGAAPAAVKALKAAFAKEGAALAVIAPRAGGTADGAIAADHALDGAPSVLFDAVVLVGSSDGIGQLASNADAQDFVRAAWRHLKVIAHDEAGAALLQAAGVPTDEEGVVALGRGGKGIDRAIAAMKGHRIWARAPKSRS